MKFENPHILHFLWLTPLIIWFFIWSVAHHKAVMRRFAEGDMLKEIAKDYDPIKRVVKSILLVFVFIFSILALARPQWGFQWQEVKREGIDILVAIDTSKSMLTRDVKPDRLQRTKLAVKDLLKKLKGDRIGLIAFSGDAFLMCPLTIDYEGFLLSLNDLDTETVPRGGTNIAKAIEVALKGYDNTPSKYKAVIIITDGDNLEGNPLTLAKKAKDEGVKLYTIGIGTKEGELIQIRNEQGDLTFLKDADGNFVKSRLNEALLQKIALATDGLYVRSSGTQFGLDVIYEQDLVAFERRQIKAKMEKKYHERFQIPLALAALLLIIESLLTVHKRIFSIAMFLLIGTTLSMPAQAASKQSVTKEANALYEKGDFGSALLLYHEALKQEAESPELNFNAGTALYKDKNFEQAQIHLQKALLSEDGALKAKASYNLGNNFYQLGIGHKESDMDKAIDLLEKSLAQFERSIELDPNDQDAKENRDFVAGELKRLKEKKKQPQSQENQQDQKSQDQQNQDSQKQDQKSKESQAKENQKDQSGQQNQQNQNDGSSGQKQNEASQSQDQLGDDEESSQQENQSSAGQDEQMDQKQERPAQSASDQSDQKRQEENAADSKNLRGNQSENEYNTKEARSSAQMEVEAGQLTPQEAQMLLERYIRSEQPQGLLNVFQNKGRGASVEKDW